MSASTTAARPTRRARRLLCRRMDWLDLVQWPAMVVTVFAAWLVASTHKHRREIGFWVFLASNALWIAWGWHTEAWALIVLQLCLAALNIRGARKAAPPG
jgi:hypothetical protein